MSLSHFYSNFFCENFQFYLSNCYKALTYPFYYSPIFQCFLPFFCHSLSQHHLFLKCFVLSCVNASLHQIIQVKYQTFDFYSQPLTYFFSLLLGVLIISHIFPWICFEQSRMFSVDCQLFESTLLNKIVYQSEAY